MAEFSQKILTTYRNAYDEYYYIESDDDSSDIVFNEYLYFSRFWQHAFIKTDIIVCNGNFETINKELLYRFQSNTIRHPILWKLFRMIFGV